MDHFSMIAYLQMWFTFRISNTSQESFGKFQYIKPIIQNNFWFFFGTLMLECGEGFSLQDNEEQCEACIVTLFEAVCNIG